MPRGAAAAVRPSARPRPWPWPVLLEVGFIVFLAKEDQPLLEGGGPFSLHLYFWACTLVALSLSLFAEIKKRAMAL